MPRACPKSPNRAWIGSVPSAVADGSNDQRAIFPDNFDCHALTHPLPRTVLTRSNNAVRLLRQRPSKRVFLGGRVADNVNTSRDKPVASLSDLSKGPLYTARKKECQIKRRLTGSISAPPRAYFRCAFGPSGITAAARLGRSA
jgi:hypothetical protein